MARFRKTGGVKLGKIGGHVTPKIRGTHRDWVLQQIDAGGDVTPQGLADGTAERDLKADNRTVRNFVHRAAKRFKKTMYGAEQNRKPIARRQCPDSFAHFSSDSGFGWVFFGQKQWPHVHVPFR